MLNGAFPLTPTLPRKGGGRFNHCKDPTGHC